MNIPEYTYQDIKDRKVDFDMSIAYGIPFVEVSLFFIFFF